MRREGARRRGREGARAAVSTLWVLAQISLLVNSPGIHISLIAENEEGEEREGGGQGGSINIVGVGPDLPAGQMPRYPHKTYSRK